MSNTVLTFTSNWQQYVIGDLEPGSQVLIAYDSNRLPNERSNYNGSPTWSIIAFYRFASDAPIQQVTLEFEGAGMVPGPQQTVSNGSSFMYATIDIPQDAQSLETWFLNSGRSGFQYWDSDFGQNYQFRFASSDIAGTVLANVVSSYPTPYSRFDVQLNAVDLAVTSINVSYRTTNIEPPTPFTNGSMDLSLLTVEGGRAVWSGSQTVPLRSNIIFVINYTVGNQTYSATNAGAGYTALGDQAAATTALATTTPATEPRLPVISA
jgi:hypothetical protein